MFWAGGPSATTRAAGGRGFCSPPQGPQQATTRLAALTDHAPGHNSRGPCSGTISPAHEIRCGRVCVPYRTVRRCAAHRDTGQRGCQVPCIDAYLNTLFEQDARLICAAPVIRNAIKNDEISLNRRVLMQNSSFNGIIRAGCN